VEKNEKPLYSNPFFDCIFERELKFIQHKLRKLLNSMHKTIKITLFLLFAYSINAQELNCTVTIGHDRINVTNTQIFKTLEKALNDFMNNTRWSNQQFNQNEKINCDFFINVTALNGGVFSATLQIQSSRPIFGSNYSSPIFNYMDKDFTFSYVEYENLNFNPNSFDSNLTGALAYYANIILGLDADSFKPNEGTAYFEVAQSIVNLAQSNSGYKGWSQQDGGNQNRYFLVQDLLSNTYNSFRKSLYQYHLQGLDLMGNDVKKGKEGVKEAIKTLVEVHKSRPNAFLTRLFFDAKSDELVQIFSGGPQVPIADLIDDLNRISPLNSSKWANMKL